MSHQTFMYDLQLVCKNISLHSLSVLLCSIFISMKVFRSYHEQLELTFANDLHHCFYSNVHTCPSNSFLLSSH
ncbi:hypothetical protein ACRRTK_002616 [Alexandromys fortis]